MRFRTRVFGTLRQRGLIRVLVGAGALWDDHPAIETPGITARDDGEDRHYRCSNLDCEGEWLPSAPPPHIECRPHGRKPMTECQPCAHTPPMD
jgi:hypothetical protein